MYILHIISYLAALSICLNSLTCVRNISILWDFQKVRKRENEKTDLGEYEFLIFVVFQKVRKRENEKTRKRENGS